MWNSTKNRETAYSDVKRVLIIMSELSCLYDP